MSPVLPIHTQRYQSGDYTLEVTAQPSPLSQWSDRPVVRRLRFSLWLERPERQRLAAGDQQQLVAISDAVEAYVQTHLTQQAWPQVHRIKLLDRTVNFSNLQLFNLAEVLNAYSQRQIILPVTSRRRRRPWQTGSAVASLLVAVGITTAYLYYRPAAFNEVATTQAPDAVFEDEVAAPEASPPAASSTPAAQAPAENANPAPTFDTSQELAQQPLDQTELEALRRLPTPSADAPDVAQSVESESVPETVAPQAAPPPGGTIAEATGQLEEQESLNRPDVSAASDLEQRSQSPNIKPADDALLSAIATQLAPYQPTDTPYPLVYHLQIAADGTILTLDPVSDNAPMLEIPADVKISPAGRLLQVEVTYTGAVRPTVREL